jgi:predicted phosphodiesterase
MRKILQFLFKKPLTYLALKFSGAPLRAAVFQSLTKLYFSSKKSKTSTKTIYFDYTKDNFIIFSDQHKGNKDAADDFATNEMNYINALNYYEQNNFSFISLGDSEELWKYNYNEVLAKNVASFMAEAKFEPNRFFKVFGNHDLIWKNKFDADRLLKQYFRLPLPIYEALILKTKIGKQELNIFCTHGHQGDTLSDNNNITSWLVAHIWAPVQRYLKINVNSPSKDDLLRNKHNRLMYEWSYTRNTHQPVFASGKYSNHPNGNFYNNETLHKLAPTYFNTGCCCFNDGDITGIEISQQNISLIKWTTGLNGLSKKVVLEQISLQELFKDLH